MKDDMREMVDFAVGLGNFAGAVLEDGKVSLSDLGTLLSQGPGLVSKGIAAVEGAENIKLTDALDPVERAEIVAYIKANLTLPNKVTEAQIESFVDSIAGVFAFIGQLKPATP